jgi:hypothetical protein
MTPEEIFREVFKDLPFPVAAVDLHELNRGLRKARSGLWASSYFIPLGPPSPRRAAFIASMHGLLEKVVVPRELLEQFAREGPIGRSGSGQLLRRMAEYPRRRDIFQDATTLIWTEQSLWPSAYASVLKGFLHIVLLHQALIEQQMEQVGARLETKGFARENAPIVSEFPRQLPTRFQYAAASLGAWLGGALNVQYFAYYATIRQIHHRELNEKYAAQIGCSQPEAKALTNSGLIVVPAKLAHDLFEAQGSAQVFGSIPLDEVNGANPPETSFADSLRDGDPRLRGGYLIDKYYRAPFYARAPDQYGFYGANDLYRPQYEAFYRSLPATDRVRCKHYCVPVITVSTITEMADALRHVPILHSEGIFFRGQRRLYPLERDPGVQAMLFSGSCHREPSLVTSASRDPLYIYDDVHFVLRRFVEEEVYTAGGPSLKERMTAWRQKSESPLCAIDCAVLALSQHYGLPSHGLDVTRSLDVAVWFATHVFSKPEGSAIASYEPLTPSHWPADKSHWPVVLVCQCATNSIGQSLHDCEELEDFGLKAFRPEAQSARFFQGGHSDHQNRLAEALVCVFRLGPGVYPTGCSFQALFPNPSVDPAYRLMMRFADRYPTPWGRYINRFHG